MSALGERRDLPVPRVVRTLARRSAPLAARDLAALERREGHVLVHASDDRMEHVLGHALRQVGWTGPRLAAEPDPLRFLRRAADPAVEAAVLLPGRGERIEELLGGLPGLVGRLRERVPVVLADCPTAQLPRAYGHGFDLVTPRLHGIYPVHEVLADASRLRRLFRDGCGQGSVIRKRPGGHGAPRGWVLLAYDPGPAFDEMVARLIESGYEWTLQGRNLGSAWSLLRQGHAYDLIILQRDLPALSGIDLLRLLAHGHARPPPCVLHAEDLDARTAEAAWHAGAWAWAPTGDLRGEALEDLLRRAMNLSRARRRSDAERGIGMEGPAGPLPGGAS